MPTRIQGRNAVRVRKTTVAENISGNVAFAVYGVAANLADKKYTNDTAIPVYVITAANLVENGGKFTLDGNSKEHPIMVYDDGKSTNVMGGEAVPVYDLNGIL